MVFVVAIDGEQVEPSDLIEFCNPRMPPFAVPRYIDVIAELPKTPSEKVKKGDLRSRGVTETTWDRLAARPA